MDKTAKRFRDRKVIAARLRRARQNADLTIRAAAAKAEIYHQKWFNWETGKSSIPSELLPGVARTVNLTAEQLLKAA